MNHPDTDSADPPSGIPPETTPEDSAANPDALLPGYTVPIPEPAPTTGKPTPEETSLELEPLEGPTEASEPDDAEPIDSDETE
jgi:hypothetical protein